MRPTGPLKRHHLIGLPKPLNTKQMIEAMETKGYWASPGGKTPHATLYIAILRDLAKGEDSRFIKVVKGHFIART